MDKSTFEFDALEEARGNWWTSTHKGGTKLDALNAQAAAMIAIAERMDKLIGLLSRVAVSSTVHAFLMDEETDSELPPGAGPSCECVEGG